MFDKPPVNRDVDAIADQAKHAYATGTPRLATVNVGGAHAQQETVEALPQPRW